ncbi:nucleoside monophosphate kinase [Streptomyces sp. NPDC056159]|uniref:nucleoside monophosphate kinase n=1 Tax=Streptomyces sp. NPDC056159 TaxID=3155537 RepID=UPI0034315A29
MVACPFRRSPPETCSAPMSTPTPFWAAGPSRTWTRRPGARPRRGSHDGRRLAKEDAATGFLPDGFPRTLLQAELLHQTLTEQGTGPDRALAFDAADEDVVRRLSGRRVRSVSARSTPCVSNGCPERAAPVMLSRVAPAPQR